MTKQAFISFLCIILIFTVLSSCNSISFYDENAVIEKGIWNSQDKKAFEVTISDTISRYNFFLNIRNDANYSFSNLYLFIYTTVPGGGKAIDTIEVQLADYDGRWLGEGMGTLKYNRIEFRRGVRFRKSGKYIFEIEQAMRAPVLKGIRDVGIRIEKEDAR